jgi:putative addiction module component (TIGR02574 family)
MAHPIIDFTHLTPEERIELATQLWDSLEPAALEPDESLADELRRRRAELAGDGELGEPWSQVFEETRERGA